MTADANRVLVRYKRWLDEASDMEVLACVEAVAALKIKNPLVWDLVGPLYELRLAQARERQT